MTTRGVAILDLLNLLKAKKNENKTKKTIKKEKKVGKKRTKIKKKITSVAYARKNIRNL
jgi:hypothetical protein